MGVWRETGTSSGKHTALISGQSGIIDTENRDTVINMEILAKVNVSL